MKIKANGVDLSNYGIEYKGDDNMNTYPTKSAYESALKTVKRYEERQATLKRLAGDLSFHLAKFDSVKFKVNKKDKKVLFSGVIDGQIKIGESVCASQDIFNEVIGKLIAVKKALGLDIEDVLEHVEHRGRIEITSDGGISFIGSHITTGSLDTLHTGTFVSK